MSVSTRGLQDIIDNYVSTRAGTFPISMARAAKTIRYLDPCPDVTSSQLTDLVANAAIKRGLAIHFDGGDAA